MNNTERLAHLVRIKAAITLGEVSLTGHMRRDSLEDAVKDLNSLIQDLLSQEE